MLNSTSVSHFTLAAYFDTGILKHLLFIIAMFFYIFIIVTNMLLIAVICVNRSLHEPMYMFLCSLFVNELYGSTGLFPFLLLQILSDVHTVPAAACFLQIFCLYTYVSVEFCNLAVMSYDRYLSICHPLQYNTRLTPSKTAVLILLTWFYPCLAITVLVSLSASLQLCGNIINKVYCDNYSIVKLACSDTTVNNIYGIIYMFTLICLGIFIFFSYTKILIVCFYGSKQTRQKAVSTCTPHLASVMNFSCGCLFEIVQSRLDMKHAPHRLHIFLSLHSLTCQLLFNPVLYGLHLTKLRSLCKSLIVGQM